MFPNVHITLNPAQAKMADVLPQMKFRLNVLSTHLPPETELSHQKIICLYACRSKFMFSQIFCSWRNTTTEKGLARREGKKNRIKMEKVVIEDFFTAEYEHRTRSFQTSPRSLLATSRISSMFPEVQLACLADSDLPTAYVLQSLDNPVLYKQHKQTNKQTRTHAHERTLKDALTFLIEASTYILIHYLNPHHLTTVTKTT